MVPILASHRRRLLQFLVVPLLPHLHEFFFPTSPYSPKIDSKQESYVHFIPVLQSVPNFRTRSVQSFLPYLLVRVFKFIDLGCVGTGILWTF